MNSNSQKNFTIASKDFWVETWMKTLRETSYTVNTGYASSRYWDNASKDYDKDDNERVQKQIRESLEMFRSNGFLYKDMRVLDIGCGTGRLAIALAQAGADVTALDFSNGMLDRLKQNCPVDLRQRIHPVHADWDSLDSEDFKWDHSFDLVTGFMTPAIRRPESFLRMMEVSCGACSVKGWAARRSSVVLEHLWKHLMAEDMKDRPPDIFFEFNLLFSMGYYPTVQFGEIINEKEVSVDDAVIHYVDYFSGLSDIAGDNLKQKITESIGSLSQDGTLQEKIVGRTGTMFWKV